MEARSALEKLRNTKPPHAATLATAAWIELQLLSTTDPLPYWIRQSHLILTIYTPALNAAGSRVKMQI